MPEIPKTAQLWEREHSHVPTLADLIARGTLPTNVLTLAIDALRSGQHIVVYGAVRSGKDTLAAALSSVVPLRTTVTAYPAVSLSRQGLAAVTTADPDTVSHRLLLDADHPGAADAVAGAAKDAHLLAYIHATSYTSARARLAAAGCRPTAALWIEIRRSTVTSPDDSSITRQHVGSVHRSTDTDVTELGRGWIDPWGRIHFTEPEKVTVRQTPDAGGRDVFTIGYAANGEPVTFTDAELSMHGVILGAPGSGRSEVLMHAVRDMLDAGWSGTVLNLEGGLHAAELRGWCRQYTHATGVDYQEVVPEDPGNSCWLHPFDGLDNAAVRTVLSSLVTCDSAYQEATLRRTLGDLLPDHDQPSPDLRTLTEMLTAACRDDDVTARRDLSDAASGRREGLTTAASRLRSALSTAGAEQVLAPGAPASRLNVRADGLTYVGLDSAILPDSAKVISSAVVGQLTAHAQSRMDSDRREPRRFLLIAGAGHADPALVADLVSVARAAGITVWLSDRALTSWQPGEWERLTNNINIRIVLRQADRDTATSAAALFASDTEAGAVTYADDLLALGVGECIVRASAPRPREERVQVRLL